MNEFKEQGGSVELLDQLKTNRPKKALSAYMIFVRENRCVISENNPGLTALEVMKEVGQRWQDLSDKEKQLYENKAVKDKKRYKQEITKFEKEIEGLSVASPTKSKLEEAKFSKIKTSKAKRIMPESKAPRSRPKPPPRALSKRASEDQKSQQVTSSGRPASSRASGKKRTREKVKPKRPLSAYIYFSQEVRCQV